MCRKSFYHQRENYRNKGHHPKHSHWMAGKMDHWARRKRFGFDEFYPPVNVQELDDRYEVFLVAPGLERADFNISLVEHVMTIAVEKKETAEKEEAGTWKRKEFSAGGFQRKFELNEKIDLDSIKAKYEDGILQVTLSKLEGEETVRKDIFVA